MLQKIKSEILAPAGSFEAAYYAFEGGADAVYLGLKAFSARYGAENFSFDQLRRLKGIAVQKSKRIYVTLNTIVAEDELEEIARKIHFLGKIEVDGIIIQDPALVEIAKSVAPNLEIHASTQMAVHNVAGVKVLRDAGFSRVVLSRELPIEMIRKIRREVPHMELEVFVHGALCYSFSGICLASGLMLGRSGNRGRCAQICRTYFDHDGEKGYFFSCNDMAFYERIRDLMDMGVESLKIEGRMKSPEYVRAVSALYRAIADGKKDVSDLKKNAELAFSRRRSNSFLEKEAGENLIGSDYPGHRGIFLGKVEKWERGEIVFRTEDWITLRDGIMVMGDTPQILSVKKMASESGKRISKAAPGIIVRIGCDKYFPKGSEIRRVSDGSFSLKSVGCERFKPAKIPAAIKVLIENSRITLMADLGGKEIAISSDVEIEESRNYRKIETLLSDLLQKSDISQFTLGELRVENRSDFSSLFINPSVLKKLKRALYEKMDEELSGWNWDRIIESFDFKPGFPVVSRENFNPDRGLIPFAQRGRFEECVEVAGYTVIPLKPVVYDNDSYIEDVVNFISSHPEKRFLVGLNNVFHISCVEKMLKAGNCYFFLDFYIYTANTLSFSFYRKRIGDSLLFAYSWLEGSEDLHDKLQERIPVVQVGSAFRPPLFYAKGCFHRHNIEKGCPSGCKKEYSYTLHNNGREFHVEVRDCVTHLFSAAE